MFIIIPASPSLTNKEIWTFYISYRDQKLYNSDQRQIPDVIPDIIATFCSEASLAEAGSKGNH